MPFGERQLSDYWVRLKLPNGVIKSPSLDTDLIARDIGERGTDAALLLLSIHHLETHPPRWSRRRTPALEAEIAESERKIDGAKTQLQEQFGIQYDALHHAAKDARVEDL